MSMYSDDKVRSSFGKKGINEQSTNKFEDIDVDTGEEEPLISHGGIKRDGMKPINMAAYAVGHVYNDF